MDLRTVRISLLGALYTEIMRDEKKRGLEQTKTSHKNYVSILQEFCTHEIIGRFCFEAQNNFFFRNIK